MSRARDRQEHVGHTYEDQWGESLAPEDRIDEGEPMTDTTATITLEIPDNVCRDLLTACYEGGSAYWLSCESVKYEGNFEKDSSTYGVAKIVGCYDGEDEETKWGDADFETMRKGFMLLLAPGADVAAHIKKDAAMCLVDYEDANWDAETADSVLQFGLLGSLVYG